MTATFRLVSTGDGVSDAELVYYSGPAARPPAYEVFTVTIGRRTRRFTSHDKADDWAAQHGVSCWRLIEQNREFPFAAKIRIDFDDSPDRESLAAIVQRFANGETLADLAEEISASPGQLRIWMLGAEPMNPALIGLRPKRSQDAT